MRVRTILVGVAVLAAALVVPRFAFAADATIRPGTLFKDTAGHVIQAHGGGMVKVGSSRTGPSSATC